MPPDPRLRLRRVVAAPLPLAPFDQAIYGADEARHTAFPTLVHVRSSGRWYCWFKDAIGHASPDGTIKSVYSDDNWNSWAAGADLEVSTTEYTNGGEDGALVLATGVIVRPYRVNVDASLAVGGWRAYVKLSTDAGATWGSAIAVTGILDGWWVPYGRIVQLTSSTLLMPGYGQDGNVSTSRCAISTDEGATWSAGPIIAAGMEYNETAIVATTGSNLVAVVRNGASGSSINAMWLVTSSDGGNTWGTPLELSFTGQCPSMVRTSSGRIYLFYRYVPTAALHYVTSDDGGTTWSAPTVIYQHGSNWDMAYPSTQYIETDNMIVCAYYTAGGASIRVAAIEAN